MAKDKAQEGTKMPKYVITCEIEGLYGYSEPGDYAFSWDTVAKETLTSRVIDFPNEIREGQSIQLNNSGEELSELVQKAYHNIAGNYTILDIGTRTVKDSDSENKARQKFNRLLQKYSFIRNL